MVIVWLITGLYAMQGEDGSLNTEYTKSEATHNKFCKDKGKKPQFKSYAK
jgi:hypothetical protein